MAANGRGRAFVSMAAGALTVALAVPVWAGCAADGEVRSESGTSGLNLDQTPAANSESDQSPEDSESEAIGGGVSTAPVEPSAVDPAPVVDLDEPSESAAVPEPEPAKDLDEVAASGSEPDFALEIVEPIELIEPIEPAGGARQESPVESTGPDESGSGTGSGGISSAQGDVYMWHDGDRTVGAQLQLDLVVLDDGTIASSDDVVADTGNGPIVRSVGGSGQPAGDGKESDSNAGGQSDSTSGSHPVFLSESGELMTLPGGILVVLDPEWNADETASFFAGNGIALSRVSALSYLTNGFFVKTDPGFASLDLANALAVQVGVELSSPNWWRERTAK